MRLINWKSKPHGACPVQSDGHFLGWYFYFRARHSRASIEFAYDERDWWHNRLRARYEIRVADAGWLAIWKCRALIYFWCLRFVFKRHKHTLIK